MTKPINYILDADIKGFFDNVDHKWLIKFLENDIEDKNYQLEKSAKEINERLENFDKKETKSIDDIKKAYSKAKSVQGNSKTTV